MKKKWFSQFSFGAVRSISKTGWFAALHAWVTGSVVSKTFQPTWLGSVTWNG